MASSLRASDSAATMTPMDRSSGSESESEGGSGGTFYSARGSVSSLVSSGHSGDHAFDCVRPPNRLERIAAKMHDILIQHFCTTESVIVCPKGCHSRLRDVTYKHNGVPCSYLFIHIMNVHASTTIDGKTWSKSELMSLLDVQ